MKSMTLSEIAELPIQNENKTEIHYCWRCKKRLPFISEEDYQRINHYLGIPLQIPKTRRVIEAHSELALVIFEEMTGYRLNDWGDINHHRLSLYGPECSKCGHMLRAPQASFCANCSTPVEH